MVRKLVVTFFLIIFVLAFFNVKNASAQSIDLDGREVPYTLPYPGLLPDHPLYFLKAVRDRVQDVFIVDRLENAKLYIHYSDKRANAARSLAEKGRNDMAITTMSKAEKYALKVPDLLKKTKKKDRVEVIEQAKTSNQKHKQLIEEFLKELPEGDEVRITEILRINETVMRGLNDLK